MLEATAYKMITNWHLERKVETGGVWSQRQCWGGVSEFQLKSQKMSQYIANPTTTCILTVAGQSAAHFWTFMEVGRDCLAVNGDVRGWLVFPAAIPAKLISNLSFTGAALRPGPHAPVQTFHHWKNPGGGMDQIFKRMLKSRRCLAGFQIC